MTYDMADRRELFVDSFLLEQMQGTTLQLHTPVQRETVFEFDKPWDGLYAGSLSVVKDRDEFRLYYEGFPKWMAKHLRCVCVATSRDGINFTRPNLGMHDRDGSKANNVCYVTDTHKPGLYMYSVFLDDRAGVSDNQRYKAVGGNYKPGGIHVFASADGMDWRLLNSDPVISIGPLDTNHVAYWSEAEQLYVCNFRLWIDIDEKGRRWWMQTRKDDDKWVHYWKLMGDPSVTREFREDESLENTGWRWTGRATSPDFINWSEPVDMGVDGESPLEHVYSNMAMPYFRAPHHIIAPAVRFVRDRTFPTHAHEDELGMKEVQKNKSTDVTLITSRGGDTFQRQFLESWIRPGLDIESWLYGSNYPALNIVPTSDEEISIYVNTHFGRPTNHVRRYTLRTDGFASLHAGYSGGEAVSRLVTFNGDQLVLNYSTSVAGSVKVGFEDVAGRSIDGFAIDDCVEMVGNSIDETVRWKGGRSLGELTGKHLRFRFRLCDADVYCMRFCKR